MFSLLRLLFGGFKQSLSGQMSVFKSLAGGVGVAWAKQMRTDTRDDDYFGVSHFQSPCFHLRFSSNHQSCLPSYFSLRVL